MGEVEVMRGSDGERGGDGERAGTFQRTIIMWHIY